jgi:hypothetical protein
LERLIADFVELCHPLVWAHVAPIGKERMLTASVRIDYSGLGQRRCATDGFVTRSAVCTRLYRCVLRQLLRRFAARSTARAQPHTHAIARDDGQIAGGNG